MTGCYCCSSSKRMFDDMICMLARCRPCCCSFRDLFQFLRSVEHFSGAIRAACLPSKCATHSDSRAARSITKFRFLSPFLSFLTRLLCPAASWCMRSFIHFHLQLTLALGCLFGLSPIFCIQPVVSSQLLSLIAAACVLHVDPVAAVIPPLWQAHLAFFFSPLIRVAQMARWYGHRGRFERKLLSFQVQELSQDRLGHLPC